MAIDFSQLSTEDLIAIKGGNLEQVSTEGLLLLKGQQTTEPTPTQVAETTTPVSTTNVQAPQQEDFFQALDRGAGIVEASQQPLPLTEGVEEVSDILGQEILPAFVQSVEETVGSIQEEGVIPFVGRVTKQGIDAFVRGIKEAPTETVLGTTGTVVGQRGGVVGSLLLGGAGTGLGSEIDQLLGLQEDTPMFDTFLRSYIYQGVGEVGGRILARKASTQLANIADSPLNKLPFMDRLKDKVQKNNVEFLYTAEDAGPAAADSYIRSVLEAEDLVLGKRQLPVTLETKGVAQQFTFDILNRVGEKGLLQRQLRQINDTITKSTAKLIQSPDTITKPDTIGEGFKDFILALDEKLSIPINQAAKVLDANAELPINVDGMYESIVKALDADVNVSKKFKGEFAKIVDRALVNRTGEKGVVRVLDIHGNPVTVDNSTIVRKTISLKEFRQLETDLQDAINTFSESRGRADAEGFFFGNTFRDIQNRAIDATRITASTDVNDPVGAFVAFRESARQKNEMLRNSRFLRQIGDNEFAQNFKEVPNERLFNNMFASLENFKSVETVIKATSPESLSSIQDAFINRVNNQLLKGGDITKSAVDSILMKNGVAQDELIIRAGRKELLDHLKGLSILLGAKETAEKAIIGEGIAIRGGNVASIPVSAAIHIKDMMALLIRGDTALGGGLEQKLASKLMSPEKRAQFLRASTTPLNSPTGYAVFIETVKGLLPNTGQEVRLPTEEEYNERIRGLQ